jgi:outer membrane usher protein
MTQPITDAFAVVDLDGVPGVRVSRNNEEIGRSDDSGQVVVAVVPSLTTNMFEIADSDVPISISVRENQKTVVPAQGVGYLVHFDLRPIAAIEGRLLRGTKPLENLEFVLRSPASGERNLRTGHEGRFQVDQVESGRYQVSVSLSDGSCDATIDVPSSKEPIRKLGDVHCEIAKH